MQPLALHDTSRYIFFMLSCRSGSCKESIAAQCLVNGLADRTEIVKHASVALLL